MFDKYNGWTNRETWCVNLWLENDEGTYHMVREWASELYEADPESARYDLAKRLEEWCDESAPDLGCTVWQDLFRSALDFVEWFEISQSWLEGLDEYVAERKGA